MEPDGSDNWWRKERSCYGPESIGLQPQYMPEEMEKIYRNDKQYISEKAGLEEKIPANVGLHAIIYAALVLDMKHIYTAGIDFYEDAEYLREGQEIDWSEEESREETTLLHQQMEDIAEMFPETEFYFITHSTFDTTKPNIHIISLQENVPKMCNN